MNTQYDNFEVILADNASSDGSVEWVKEHFPEVIIATFDENYGYTGGNNRAVSYASKEILLFLNNDVRVDEHWLNGLDQVFSSDPDVAAAQPKLLSYEQPDHFEYAGAAGGFIDKLGYPYCRGRIMDTVEKDTGQYDSQIEITWASGAALAIRKQVFENLGGFDEDFQFHMEEIDLCWRTLNAGYKIIYTPDSKVYHLGGGSLPMGSARKVYFNFRNNLFMLWKNLPASQLWYKILLRMALDQIAAVRSLVSGKPSEFGAIIKAHLHFLKGLVRVNKKRSNYLINPNSKVLSPVLIIWEYFLKKKRTFNEL